MTTRRRFSGEFKAKVAPEALRGDKTIQEIATRHKVHPDQVSAWKQRAVEGMKEVFTKGAERERGEPRGGDPGPACEDRRVDGGAGFFGKRAQVVSREKRRTMIRRDHPELSLSRQCRLLSISRSSVYNTPQDESAQNLELMRRIDKLFLKYPFYLGRHRARRLLRLMGLQAIYQVAGQRHMANGDALPEIVSVIDSLIEQKLVESTGHVQRATTPFIRVCLTGKGWVRYKEGLDRR